MAACPRIQIDLPKQRPDGSRLGVLLIPGPADTRKIAPSSPRTEAGHERRQLADAFLYPMVSRTAAASRPGMVSMAAASVM
jgi:hypothetical protein